MASKFRNPNVVSRPPTLQDMLRGWEFNPTMNYQDAGQELPPAGVAPNDILVQAEGPATAEDPYLDFNLSNARAVEERMAALQGGSEASAPERKGMFGIKGTLRDILGTVGDAFLVQSGNQRVYAPQRERERLGDAMAGFTRDPYAAAERVGGMNPEMAQQLYQYGQLGDMNRAKNEQQAIVNAREDVEAQRKAYEQGATMFSQFAGAVKLDPSKAAQFAPAMQRIKEVYGLGDEFVVPGEGPVDAGLYSGYQFAGAAPSAQLGDERGRQQIGVSEFNAQTSRINATRPRPGPAPRQPRAQTTLEYFQEVGAIPEGQRTKAQQDFYDDYVKANRGGRKRVPSSGEEKRRVRLQF